MEINFNKLRGFSKAALASFAVVGLVGVSACSTESGNEASGSTSAAASSADELTIFATTGYIADTVKNVAPDAEVITMVGPGGDPHTYQPTTKDIDNMQQADVVFWSGLGMEAKMTEQLEGLGEKQVAVAEAIPTQDLLPWEEEGEEHEHGEEGHDHGDLAYDPHVWNSTDNWKYVVDAIVEKLVAVDADHAADYEANGESYKQEIDEAAAYVQEKIDAIPADSRVLITGHDAFNYFGKQFGLEIHATDFVTSEAQMTASDLSDLAELIAQHKVKTIFQDNLGNPQTITSLKEAVAADGWEVEISDEELYADSLGTEAPMDTYLGVLKHNADAISAALA